MGAHGIWIFPSLLKPFPSFQLRVPLLLWSFPKISHFLFMEIKWETMGIHLLGEWVFDTNNSFSMLAQDLIQKEKERNKEGTSYLPIKSKIFMHSCIPLKAQGRWSLQGSRCLAPYSGLCPDVLFLSQGDYVTVWLPAKYYFLHGIAVFLWEASLSPF